MKLRKLIYLIAAVGLLGGGGYFIYRSSTTHAGVEKSGGEGEATRSSVKTVHPKRDANFRISNEQVASVEPFYQAGLRARASGVVRSVSKEIGEPVHMGDVLVEIDAPELIADVEQKEAVIRQRKQDLRVSQAMVKHAEAAVEAAKATISQRVAESKQSAFVRDYKKTFYTRVKGLLADGTVTPEAVAEQERDYLSAEAAHEAAVVAIQKAKADQMEKEASLEAAKADIDLKSALIAVAEKDRDRASASADFARLTAPFDGVLIKRRADPGMFVQNATTSSTEPLVTLARLDIVTVVMKLPDVAAPYIGQDTEVEVSLHDRPDLKIHGKVTRFSPAIDGTDKTMRVEVDVFNGSKEEFQNLMGRTFAEIVTPIAVCGESGVPAALLAAERHRRLFHKGVSAGTAICPEGNVNGRTRPIVPGMTASMKVYLDRVSTAYLLPASAVYGSGGKTFILLVQDGVTKQVPVRVQVNDGKLAKVAMLPRTGEVGAAVHELTGTEEVVVTRQTEVGDGVKVKTVLGDW